MTHEHTVSDQAACVLVITVNVDIVIVKINLFSHVCREYL